MALYNDRVYAFERMAALDKVIDQDPSTMNLRQMVTDDERNHLAFLELDNFSKHGAFLYKHPILKQHKLHNELDALRRASPDRFMNEMVNADKNITRYRSMIKNNKYRDPQEKVTWEGHVKNMEEKLEIMKKLISQ
jgi:hypothetical protein